MKKFILILFSSMLLLASCAKQFDVKETNYVAGSTVVSLMDEEPALLKGMPTGIYSYMVEALNNMDSHDDFGYLSCLMISDFMGQDIAFGAQHFGMYDYIHDYGSADYGRVSMIWTTFYTMINNANSIIDIFDDNDPESSALKGYLGQAYALRALSYTCLLYFFQDPIKADGTVDVDKPSVPIRYAARDKATDEVKEAHAGRTPIGDVMDHIEFNIDKALPLLNGYQRDAKIEIDYSVAQGIAARYYLFAQKWQEAADAAHAAQAGYTLMNEARLKEGFNEIEDAEVMWGFDHSTETATSYASFFSHMCCESAGYGSVAPKCIDAYLYSLIPNTDYRKALFNGPAGSTTGKTSGARKPYANRKFGNAANWLGDYIYMRAAEMYLIEAEGYARQTGKEAQAKAALAALMAKRDPSWNEASVTVDDVLLQRRIELWGEGFSTFDLIRNALPAIRNYNGTNHPSWGARKYDAHDKLWFFQIPLSELNSNTAITEDEQTPLS